MRNCYYKYRPLYQDSKPHPFTESIFTKRQIYYSAPSAFNDPFDCNLKLHAEGATDEEWIRYYKDLERRHEITSDEATKVIACKLWRICPDISKDIGKDVLKKIYHESSVFCLSKKANSIPMFSYYADGHKGIAIEFSFSNEEVPCGFCYDREKFLYKEVVPMYVNYPLDFPELNYLRIYDKPVLSTNLIFTKSKKWSHEEEFRIFRRYVQASTVSFDHNLITKVIFGCKTEDKDVALVKDWLKDWPSKVTLKKAEMLSSKYELNIEKDLGSVGGNGC